MNEKRPDWLRVRVQSSKDNSEVHAILEKLSLHTVCEEANCPNLCECFGRKTATFMILGKNCTRNCTFCNIKKDLPQLVDENEPEHVAQAVQSLGLKHVVITSVTRDDLSDGGSRHFAKVIEALKNLKMALTIEVLIPDFQGDATALSHVVSAKPHIINHNIETVPRLYSKIRPMAIYSRSLALLKHVKQMDSCIYTKSGLMVGLGETQDEIRSVLKELKQNDCDFLTIGQYLSPSPQHYPVMDYVHPDLFQQYQQTALEMGFSYVASAPLVRSSYRADQALEE